MTLKKADYRVHLDAAYKDPIAAQASALGLDPAAWIAQLVQKVIDQSAHAATLLTQAAVRSGLVRFEAVGSGKQREGAA
ncbi:MAG: hypothetical protein RL341_2138 [Pseudomonadota bacterium]|jgi:hypothetical protein